jgi:phospholipid N-methyltransferase
LDLVERNAEFVRCLADRLARDDHYRAAAARIRLHHARIEELSESEPFDVIISGLPLNNFPVELVEQILAKLRRLLAPSGTLSFFEYVAIRRAKGIVARQAERDRLRGIGEALESLLGEHEIGRDCVLANVPPAWVHHVRFSS